MVLDLDDTLFLTELASWEIENAALERAGYAPMSREVHRSNWGKPIIQALPERVPDVDLERFFQYYPEVINEFVRDGRIDVLSDENLTALRELHTQGFFLAVVTSRKDAEIAHLLDDTHRLSQFIPADAFFHGGNCNYVKPDPRVFDGLLKFRNASECVYVGDSQSDCNAAKSAGLHFVACLESGLRQRSDFEQLAQTPDGYIEKFADLPMWLMLHNQGDPK